MYSSFSLCLLHYSLKLGFNELKFCCSKHSVCFIQARDSDMPVLLQQRHILKWRWLARIHSLIKKPITDAGVRNMIAEWWIHRGNGGAPLFRANSSGFPSALLAPRLEPVLHKLASDYNFFMALALLDTALPICSYHPNSVSIYQQLYHAQGFNGC